MPADGEHPPTHNFLFPLRLGGFKIHTCCGVRLGFNFLAQLALAAFKEELMVRKGHGKEGGKKKSRAEERKPPPSHTTLSFSRVRSSSEGIRCGQDRLVWT